MSIDELEAEVIQTAITAHCKPDDGDYQELHHKAVSALIEARYQSVKSSDAPPAPE
jgi:hypothetical protein